MAKRLFDEFLVPSCRKVGYFDDPSLNSAAENHPHIRYFCSAALSAPNSPHKTVGKVRIHQALENAGWDIEKLREPVNLGVPAFNDGNKYFGTGDFGNGLGLMINGVQHVYVIATNYFYDKRRKEYRIGLKFVFYDVFGLDDDDVVQYGLSAHWYVPDSPARAGITSWWQLQHQHGYAPLITRIILEQHHVVRLS